MCDTKGYSMQYLLHAVAYNTVIKHMTFCGAGRVVQCLQTWSRQTGDGLPSFQLSLTNCQGLLQLLGRPRIANRYNHCQSGH
jgi:hypothetical protein